MEHGHVQMGYSHKHSLVRLMVKHTILIQEKIRVYYKMNVHVHHRVVMIQIQDLQDVVQDVDQLVKIQIHYVVRNVYQHVNVNQDIF